MFNRLPPELLECVMEEIWKRSDRKNLAYSCKAIYHVMKPFLWQRLELKAGYIYHKENILKNKHFIQDLTLRFHRKDIQNLSDFLRVIFEGGSMNISDLFLEGNVPDDVFSLLMLKSTHLQTILLSIHSDDFRWDYQGLVIPSKLKSLQFWNSNVTDIFLTSIINANLETMEELDISLCLTPHSCASQLTPKGYIAISELVHLKRLTLF